MKCLLCNNHETKEIYTYRKGTHIQESMEFFPDIKIQTCQECKISYCSNAERNNLDNYYYNSGRYSDTYTRRIRVYAISLI